jgi:lipoic acid synthetase
MGIGELLLLAVGVSMDAFAVSICKGLAMKKATLKGCMTCGVWFGGFQALMPTIGFFLGTLFAEAIQAMKLKHAVITSVNRDEQKDGAAWSFSETIRLVREKVPGCQVEVLIPDFKGNWAALQVVIDAKPDILKPNTETVPRLYRQVRLGARYERSLDVLAHAKQCSPAAPTKSGLMLGLGETAGEVLQVMRDLRAHQVDILTIGQYLRPSPKHLPIVRYVTPEEFAEFRLEGQAMGFSHVESGPLVRSSYHASDAVPA